MIRQITSTAAPTLAAGAFSINCEDMEAVTHVAIGIEGPQVVNRIFASHWAASGPVITITVEKMQLSATNTWGAAATGDLTSKTITVVAEGY